jgi:hypothetical protein
MSVDMLLSEARRGAEYAIALDKLYDTVADEEKYQASQFSKAMQSLPVNRDR